MRNTTVSEVFITRLCARVPPCRVGRHSLERARDRHIDLTRKLGDRMTSGSFHEGAAFVPTRFHRFFVEKANENLWPMTQ